MLDSLAKIVWFDLFDYPLTLLELGKEPDLKLLSWVTSTQGFYCLKGREGIIRTRLQRATLAHAKYKKAHRAASIFALLPFVRMVAIGNTLGYNNARQESDIDFFVVAKEGHIFLVRFLTTLIAKLFRWRPTLHHKQDTICLSFFVSDNALNLQAIQDPQLVNTWPYDIYLRYWITQLTLLYDSYQCYERFIKENAWVHNMLPQAHARITVARGTIALGTFQQGIKNVGEWFLKMRTLEYWLEEFQRNRLPLSLQEKVGHGTGVVINSSMLKLHDHDKRAWFAKEFLQRYEKLAKTF